MGTFWDNLIPLQWNFFHSRILCWSQLCEKVSLSTFLWQLHHILMATTHSNIELDLSSGRFSALHIVILSSSKLHSVLIHINTECPISPEVKIIENHVSRLNCWNYLPRTSRYCPTFFASSPVKRYGDVATVTCRRNVDLFPESFKETKVHLLSGWPRR